MSHLSSFVLNEELVDIENIDERHKQQFGFISPFNSQKKLKIDLKSKISDIFGNKEIKKEKFRKLFLNI